MKKIFLDAPLYIKVFASAFVALASLTTGAFYYVGGKLQAKYNKDLLQIHKAKEMVNAQHRQLSYYRRTTIP
ncbi:hypothetical protein DNK47_00500 [Mycoplasma wenyonii]|uniref:Uncharacterized protein n=1 Tax=Mycoplasma wenyonii TaxID=65123 RepID=A0A328PR20_9MOLU|nr:hypothetical protein [Mycoplasma wenyonii]RAO95318.1 hypothetical protein DNK47_00500 [Mycoplasma wenyonii]